MKLRYQFIVQEVGGDSVAVAVGKDAAKFNGLIRLNATGKVIFEGLKEGISEEEIVERITERFECDKNQVKQEVHDFITKLEEQNLLVK